MDEAGLARNADNLSSLAELEWNLYIALTDPSSLCVARIPNVSYADKALIVRDGEPLWDSGPVDA